MNCHERASHRSAKVQPRFLRPTPLGISLLRDPFVLVPRATHDDAHRPTMIVRQHQDDRFDEFRVNLMRGRHQKMALKRLHVQVSLVVAPRFRELFSIHPVHQDLVRQASLGGDAQLIEATAHAYGIPRALTPRSSPSMISINWSTMVCANRFVCGSPVRSRMAIAVFITRTKRASLKSGVDNESSGSSMSSATGRLSAFWPTCATR